ncbi:hypothetical protein N7E81_14925 [Reichenbachiella carrageenanivorans]|uniref:Uncharacterized protein n=1 Tax=Reichenbachiella carrageenanivorans TaxID=2979869 RepID=A0ABY6CXL2_9BACT|nr:hypothetical protein [Reichenbachiella carrageenanivorans]UXX78652.1 hypothetical protein N7E81_14925 [Reichenbachiella carrageenanivorans]
MKKALSISTLLLLASFSEWIQLLYIDWVYAMRLSMLLFIIGSACAAIFIQMKKLQEDRMYTQKVATEYDEACKINKASQPCTTL